MQRPIVYTVRAFLATVLSVVSLYVWTHAPMMVPFVGSVYGRAQ